MYIKVDVATRIRVNYLGINVRFIDQQTLLPATKTLALKDTFDQHSSDSLRQMLSDTLEDYKIDITKVVSIVSDNASNMVKMVKDMIITPDERESDNDTDADDSGAEDPPGINEQDEDSETGGHLDSDEETESSVPKNQEEDDLMLQGGVRMLNLQHMRCVAHTLQLAINDGLKSGAAQKLIGIVRNVSKEARRLTRVFKERGFKTALIDQETRWGSIYLMVDRLIELKDCVKDLAKCGNKKLQIRDYQWVEIEQLGAILKKPYEFTLKIQSEDLTAGVFYRLSSAKFFSQFIFFKSRMLK